MSVATSGGAWAAAVESVLEASAAGPERVAEAVLAAASVVTTSGSAALIRWHSDGPKVLFSTGTDLHLPVERLPEGAGVVGERPAATVPFGSSTDLVVARGRHDGAFDLDELRALRILAVLGAQATDRSQEAFAALYGVATKLLGSRDLEEVLLAIANATSQVLRAEVAGLFLVDASGECLEMRSVVGHRTVQTARLRVRHGQGLAGKVFSTGQVHRVDDWTTDPSITKEFLSIASREGTQSGLCAPMRVAGRTVGVVCAWRRRRSIFTEADARIMSALADLGTVAVEKARIDQAEREAAARLQDAHRELEDRYQEAERALRIHQELTQIAVEGAEMGEVVRSLRSLTDGSVVVVSEEGRPVAHDETPDEELVQLVQAWQRWRPREPERASYLIEPSDGRSCWTIVVPIRAARIDWGCLAVSLAAEPSRGDTVAAEQAATVCALLVAREEAAAAATRRLETEFVWDLLEGRVTDEAEALVRARQMQRTLPKRARVVLVRVYGWEQLMHSEHWTAEQLERARGRMGQALLERLGQLRPARVTAHRADLFVVLAPLQGGDLVDHARQLGELAVSAVESPTLRAAAGVGGVVESVLEFPEGFRQARFALAAAALPEHPVMVFDELGVLQFLLTPSDRGDLDRFVEQTLGVLLAYDRAHKTKLIATVEAYLASDCNLHRAAQRLFVHPKTMRYRLQRMHSLTGLRFDQQDDRFNLQLALKILRLNPQEGAPPPD
ncbi:MAG TPA: helix-turn-helix domain-containing protein [Jiangellaceae bacterium]|jgi:sugar diacid utilization regulator/putative methionine-R-sulfoxide reductase with GAF domain|nr:helix-turn-helix domain-containing protein [Jiangellaceae bacterium]